MSRRLSPRFGERRGPGPTLRRQADPSTARRLGKRHQYVPLKMWSLTPRSPNLIVRREETAAMRSQANTAKVLEGNPTLMRLRELEVLERVATSGKLNVVLGEKGLAERVVNLL